MRRTTEQIELAKQKLLEERKTLPEYSAFGDNNYKRIDYQLEALGFGFENEDAIYALRKEDREVTREMASEIADAHNWALGEDNDFDEFYQ